MIISVKYLGNTIRELFPSRHYVHSHHDSKWNRNERWGRLDEWIIPTRKGYLSLSTQGDPPSLPGLIDSFTSPKERGKQSGE